MATKKWFHVRPSEHYTVMLALVISLITTFLLGMLLTDTLWSGGLNYFSNVAREGQVNRMKASYIQQYINAVRTQNAEAAVLDVAPLEPSYTTVPCVQVGECRNSCWTTYVSNAGLKQCDTKKSGVDKQSCYTKKFTALQNCLNSEIQVAS
jgi:hypothetical protein